MGLRTFGLWRRMLFAATPIPLLALGYFASKPANFMTLQLVFSGEMSSHARQTAGAEEVKGRPLVPADARFLFLSQGKGPRADQYHEVRRATAAAKKPRYMMAALSPLDVEITGSIGKKARRGDVVDRSRKAEQISAPISPTRKPETEPLPAQASAAVFMTSLKNSMDYGFPGGKPSTDDTARTLLALAKPSKIARGLVFKGETEAEYQGRQRRCLATAIYFEARGEPVQGQLAVAQVVMNRVRSEDYPDTICGVVFQGQWRRKGCQFSFACDGIADVPREESYWRLANKLAKRVTGGKVWLEGVGHATHYHATYVKPRWRREMNRIKTIGRHIFYRRPNDQIEEAGTSTESPDQGLALAQSG